MSSEAPQLPGTAVSRSPLMEMLAIAAPVIASMASMPVMTFIDRYFCGQLGVEELAAAGNGGMVAWVPASIVMGVIGVVNSFVSQNLGAGTPRRGAAYAWNALWIVTAAWLVLFIPYALFLPEILHWTRGTFGADHVTPKIAELEVAYGRIIIIGLLVTLGGRCFHQYFFGMHRTLVPMVGVIAGNIVNFALTWALVFGHFGLPALGVVGSAVGTVIGASIEFFIPLAVFLSPSYRKQFGTHEPWRPALAPLKDILRIGWPAGLMFGSEMLCWGIFLGVLVAQFGPEHNAASHVAMTYMQMSFMPAVGLSIGVQAIVGKCIGQGRHDLASARAWLGVRVTMLYMGLCAAAFVVFRYPLVSLLIDNKGDPAETARIVDLAAELLILAATFQVFDALGITMIGALRGAGDTVWPGVMTVILSWTIIIGGGTALCRWVPQWHSYGPWVAAAIYIILFAFGVAWRWQSGAWKKIRLLEGPQPDAPALSPAANPAEAQAFGG